jgi:activator of 2-hydroxyglutaryl-CoA dehydratase
VFAESEVIKQLSLGAPPAEIMHGAISSLVDRFSAVDTTSADGT